MFNFLDFVSDTFSNIFGVEKTSHHDDCKLQCDAMSYSFSGLTATAVAILNHGAIVFASSILYSILIHALARMNMAFLLSSPPLFPTLPPFYEWKLKIGFSDSSVRLAESSMKRLIHDRVLKHCLWYSSQWVSLRVGCIICILPIMDVSLVFGDRMHGKSSGRSLHNQLFGGQEEC